MEGIEFGIIQPHAQLPLGWAGGAAAYPDLVDPVIQGAKLISLLVEDGLLQLQILIQSLHEAHLV